MGMEYTDADSPTGETAGPCAYFDPALADQPLPPAQPGERHESQRLVFDMPPLVRMPSTPAADADAAPVTPLPRLRSVGGHWRTVYQAELAALSITGLVQEQQKQERMVAKAERDDLPWLPKARARLHLVETELAHRVQQHTFHWAA